MSRPDLSRLDLRLPPDASEPTFAKPWQATAFAMTVHLHERGQFSWSEWAGELGLQAASGDPYYECWLRALEALLARKALAAPGDVDALAAAWMRAAHATPHGQPVALDNDT